MTGKRLILKNSAYLGVLFLGVLAAWPAIAQVSGDDGRTHFDVPFVPTPQVTVDEMLRLANVGPKDFVLDLG